MTTCAQSQEAQAKAAIPPASGLLTFGTDVALRSRWFVPASFQHPAKLHLGLLHWIVERYTKPGETIADPMAGSGSVLYAATIQRNVVAREIEPRWLALLRENAAHITLLAGLFAGSIDIGQADAREPWGYQADHVIFSPPYGNEASSSPLAHRALKYQQLEGRRWKSLLARVEEQQGSWGSVMFHYGTHALQIGHFRGKRYWQAMHLIYTQASASLRQHGYLILIVKDHIRDRKRMATAALTINVCEELGFRLYAHHQRHLQNLSLWQRRRKERGEPVVEEEDILVFKKGVQI
jgi:predicted RNA methylase